MKIESHMAVLVADASESFRRNVRQMLREMGVPRTVEARDGDEAWFAVNDEALACVICDWNLPGMTGLELLHKIKWSEDFSSIPFIMLSDDPSEERISQAVQLGVAEYMVKPVTADVLKYKLEKALSGEAHAIDVLPGQAAEPATEEAAPSPVAAPASAPAETARPAAPAAPAAPRPAIRLPDIGEIIAKKKVNTSFQPMLDIEQRAILGFEALTRGFIGREDEEIAPAVLFQSGDAELTVALDAICREKSMATFAPLARQNASFLLALKVDAANLRRGDSLRLADVFDSAGALGIAPQRVVLGVVESQIADDAALATFIDNHRTAGFKIAFDKVTQRHLDFERILDFRPDYIKLDRSMVENVDKELYKQEAVSTVMSLAKLVGAHVIGSGIEREEEALALLEKGVTLLQGYYFDQPLKKDIRGIEKYLYQVEYLGYKFIKHAQDRIIAEEASRAEVMDLTTRIRQALSNSHPDRFERILDAALRKHQAVLGLYILNDSGVQVTRAVTVCGRDASCRNEPPAKGARHYLRDFFLHARSGFSEFITEPYVTRYTGGRCRTIASAFNDASQKRYILCVDVTA